MRQYIRPGLVLTLATEGGRFTRWIRLLFHERVGILENQSLLQHIIHVGDQLQLDGLQDNLRNLFDVLLIFLRHKNLLDASPMSRQDFFFQSANRKNGSPEGNFPRHGYIVAYRRPRQSGNKRSGHGDAR